MSKTDTTEQPVTTLIETPNLRWEDKTSLLRDIPPISIPLVKDTEPCHEYEGREPAPILGLPGQEYTVYSYVGKLLYGFRDI